MKGFAVIFLMVMMLCLMAPMTAMASVDMGASPVLTITMEIWSDVVTATARGVPIMGESKTHEETINYMEVTLIGTTGTGLIFDKGSSHLTTTDYEISATMVTGSKIGGGAISPFG